MSVLELFSGTGSVGKVCNQLGWDVVSVDMISEATHKVDIMLFDYKQYPKDSFDIVWASLQSSLVVYRKSANWETKEERVHERCSLL